jgi:hypothetical protein
MDPCSLFPSISSVVDHIPLYSVVCVDLGQLRSRVVFPQAKHPPQRRERGESHEDDGVPFDLVSSWDYIQRQERLTIHRRYGRNRIGVREAEEDVEEHDQDTRDSVDRESQVAHPEGALWCVFPLGEKVRENG